MKEKVGIVACSNGQPEKQREKIEHLLQTLMGIDMIPILSNHIYAKETAYSGTGQERAESLMKFYRDADVKRIFDISGGDMGNEVLPYLDYEEIKNSDTVFWGYSDLTTVINAIYTKTGKSSVLYQIRNLINDATGMQLSRFDKKELFDVSYQFLQGESMRGTLIGGNIRCLLKLAGTEYWPDMQGKILLLEAMSGTVPKMATCLSQLKQMGVFDKINGILLGTFTKMEGEHCRPTMEELVMDCVGPNLPIAKTYEIGHGVDSKAIVIGGEYDFKK